MHAWLQRLAATAGLFIQAVNCGKRWLYRIGVLHAQRAPRPVISIGNIAFGGTGKTPTTLEVVRTLHAHGLAVCVLTRGYRRKKSAGTWLVNPKKHTASDVGDEPLLLAQYLVDIPDCHVVVDAKRARAAHWAAGQFRVDVFIMDDGFSHHKLARDCDLVLLGKQDLSCLAPRRELRRTLSQAHAIASYERIESQEWNILPLKRVIRGVRRAQQADSAGAATHQAADTLRGARVGAMAAIANPSRFVDTLEQAGAAVVCTQFFADHHAFEAGSLEAMAARDDIDAVVITEKDAVKLHHLPPKVWVVEIGVELPAALGERLLSVARGSSV